MPRDNAELDQALTDLDAEVQRYEAVNDAWQQDVYTWGSEMQSWKGGVDTWGSEMQAWKDDVDTWGSRVQSWIDNVDQFGHYMFDWMNGVDRWGESAERRFAFLHSRQSDDRREIRRLNEQVLALRQLTQVTPILPLVLGIIAGVATGLLVGFNSSRSDWWVLGVAVAVGAIVFGVCYFLVSARNSRTVRTGRPPAEPTTNAQQQPQPAPAQNAPTQPVQAVPPVQPAQQPVRP